MKSIIRSLAVGLIAALLGWVSSAGQVRASTSGFAFAETTGNAPASLFAQSAAEVLDHEFRNRDVSFLLLDAHSGAVLASNWEGSDSPIPVGSLLKPFVALAYGERHQFSYPMHTCRGTASGCWLPSGHGRLDLTSAIAYSCNSYFRVLTADMTGEQVSATAIAFGLQPPPPETSGAELAGMGNRWLVSPRGLARAYLELARRSQQPGVRRVLDGMAESAGRGTGAAVDRALAYSTALAKTGTAACTHAVHAPGDGFTVALFPRNQAEIVLLVRVHGVPGSEAAKTVGQMLRRIEE